VNGIADFQTQRAKPGPHAPSKMPPKGFKFPQPKPDIEHTPEYDEFIKRLTEFHEKRG